MSYNPKARMWKDRVRSVYNSLAELEQYNDIYNIAQRCGYATAAELWADNPLIQGSTNPADFGLARQPRRCK